MKGKMKGLVLGRTMVAHIYLRIAIGRPAQLLWELRKQLRRMKKGREERMREERYFLAEGAVHTKSYFSDPDKYMKELTGFFEWSN